MAASETHDVDTGVLSFSFSTAVSNAVQSRGALQANLRCDSDSSIATAPSCATLTDYGSTFDAELTSSVAGIGFSDYTPGVFPALPKPA